MTGELKSVQSYDTHGDGNAANYLNNFIAGVNQYSIIAIVSQDEPSLNFHGGDAIMSIGGTRSSLTDRSSYALLGFKGPWSVSWKTEVYNIRGQGPSVITKKIKLPSGNI